MILAKLNLKDFRIIGIAVTQKSRIGSVAIIRGFEAPRKALPNRKALGIFKSFFFL